MKAPDWLDEDTKKPYTHVKLGENREIVEYKTFAENDDTGEYVPYLEYLANPITQDILPNSLDLFASALENGANPNIKNQDDMPLIVYATASQQEAFVEKLCQTQGIDVNAKDANGGTALHFAVHTKNEDIASFLLDAGANPNIPSKRGTTPFDMADNSGDNGIITVLESKSKHPKPIDPNQQVIENA